MLTREEELKMRIYECIAANADKLCDSKHYYDPEAVAAYTDKVYDKLFKLNKDE